MVRIPSARKLISVIMALLLGMVTGCVEKKDLVTQKRPGAVLFVYGDCRTGFYKAENWRDNVCQRIHRKLALHMVERASEFGDISHKAVLFSGDSVHMGHCDEQWISFLDVLEIFNETKLRLYPAIGNHELHWLPCFLAPNMVMELESFVKASEAKDYKVYYSATTQMNEIQQRIMEKEEKELSVASPKSRLAKAFKVLEERYKPELDHLKNVSHSYYSFQLIDKPLIKIVILDTNSLDSEEQLAWFESEVKKVGHEGIAIVMGHHPPGIRGEDWRSDVRRANKYWKKFYSPFFNHARVPLWIAADVHNYQLVYRKEANEKDKEPETIRPPVIIVSGGGGAPLSPESATIKPEDDSWNDSIAISAYHYLEVKIFPDSIDVIVRGMKKPKEPIREMDRFRIGLKRTS